MPSTSIARKDTNRSTTQRKLAQSARLTGQIPRMSSKLDSSNGQPRGPAFLCSLAAVQMELQNVDGRTAYPIQRAKHKLKALRSCCCFLLLLYVSCLLVSSSLFATLPPPIPSRPGGVLDATFFFCPRQPPVVASLPIAVYTGTHFQYRHLRACTIPTACAH